MATNSQTVAGTATNQCVTPAGLYYQLTNAPPIGIVAAGNAYFNNANINTMNGSVMASAADVSAATSNKVVPASTLNAVLAAPPVLGATTANSANFTTVTASGVAGSAVAGSTDVQALTSTSSTSKIVTPSALYYALQSPPAIGATTANTGKFTTLTATTVQATNAISPLSGGTGNNVYAKGDILVATSASNLSKIALGTVGNVLTVSSTAPSGVAWSPPPAPTATTSSQGYVTLSTPTLTQATTNNTTAVTPACLPAIFMAPPTIGGTSAGDAYFNNLTAGSVAGAVVAQNTDTSSTNKVVTPAMLTYVLQGSNVSIGSTVASNIALNSGTIAALNSTSLTSGSVSCSTLSVTNPPWPVYSFSSTAEAVAMMAANKMLAPSNMPPILASPAPIGASSPNSGVFTTLSCNTLNVANPPWAQPTLSYATAADVQAASSTTKVLCPANITTMFANPLPLGSAAPNSAEFTTVSANSYTGALGSSSARNTAFVSTIDATAVVGSSLATATDIPVRTAGKLVTADSLDTVFANSGPLGTAQKNIAIVSDLTADTINGSCIAPLADALSPSINNKIVTPKALAYAMSSPPPIGGSQANYATFTSLTCDSLAGGCIATNEDVNAGTSVAKAVTPAALAYALSTPTAIGSGTPAPATFTMLSASRMSVSGNAAVAGSVAATQFVGTLGSSTARNTAYVDILDANSVSASTASFGSIYGQMEDIQGDVKANTIELTSSATAATFYGQLGDPSSYVDAYVATLNAKEIIGPVGSASQRSAVYASEATVSGDLSVAGKVSAASIVGSLSGDVVGKLSGQVGDVNTRNDAYVAALTANTVNTGTVTAMQVNSQIGDQNTRSAVHASTVSADRVFATVGDSDASKRNAVYASSVLATTINVEGNMYAAGTFYGSIGDAMTRYDVYANTVNANCVTGQLGDGISPPQDAYVASVHASQLYGQLGNSTSAMDVYAHKITAQSIDLQGVLSVSGIESGADATFGTVYGTLGSDSDRAEAFVSALAVDSVACSGDIKATGDIGADGVSARTMLVYSDATVAGALTCGGAIVAEGTIAAAGAHVSGLLECGSATVSGNLSTVGISANSIVCTSDATVGGSLHCSSGLSVGGPVALASDATVSGALVCAGLSAQSIDVEHNVGVSGSLCVVGAFASGSATVGGSLQVVDGLAIGGNVACGALNAGSTTVTGSLMVASDAMIVGSLASADLLTGAATVDGALSVHGSASFTADALVGGDAEITGAATIGGALACASAIISGSLEAGNALVRDLIVQGTPVFARGLAIGGDSTVEGALAISSMLDVSGDATVGGSLSCVNGISIASSTECTNTGVGALVVAGGVGVAKSLRVGGSIASDGYATIGGDLDVSGVVTIADNNPTSIVLRVTGTQEALAPHIASATFAGGLGVEKSMYVGGSVHAGGSLSGSGLGVSGAATAGSLTCIDAATVGGSLAVSGGASVGTGLSIGGDVSIGGAMTCESAVSLTGALDDCALYVASSLDSDHPTTGSVVIAGGLGVAKTISVGESVSAGAASIAGSLGAGTLALSGSSDGVAMTVAASTDVSFDGSGVPSASAVFSGGVAVGRSLYAGGDLSCHGTLKTDFNAAVGAKLSVGSSASVAGSIAVAKDASVGGALAVTGGLSVGGAITVAGDITLSDVSMGAITATSASVTGEVTVSGDANVGGALHVANAASITGTLTSADLTVSGAIAASGALSAGDASLGNLSVGGSISASKGVSADFLSLANDLVVGSLLDSASTNTGAIVVSGGVGIGKSVSVGGSMSVTGSVVTGDMSVGAFHAKSVASGDLSVIGNAEVSQDLSIGGSIIIDGAINAAGALSGASISVQGAIAGDTLSLLSATDSVGSTSGALIVAGGVGVAKSLTVGSSLSALGPATMFSGANVRGAPLVVSCADDCVSSTTGALQVAGGLYVGQSMRAVGNVAGGSASFGASAVTSLSVSGAGDVDDQIPAAQITGGLTVGKAATISGELHVAKSFYSNDAHVGALFAGATTVDALTTTGLADLGVKDSTSPTSGSIVTAGGLGVAKSLNVGGEVAADTFVTTSQSGIGLMVASETDASAVDSAAVVVSGGLGVAKSAYVGGSLSVGGALSVGSLSLATPLAATKGGTGFASYAAGDLLVGTGSGLGKLSSGSSGDFLVSTDSGLSWGGSYVGNYMDLSLPRWLSASTYSIAGFGGRAADGSLISIGAKTINFATTGLNGLAVGAGTGTLMLGGTTTVTGVGTSFTTDLLPGDSVQVGIDMRKVVSVDSDVQLTVDAAFPSYSTAQVWSRGGLYPHTVYYLYALSGGSNSGSSGVTPGYILSQRSSLASLVDIPEGYSATSARQMPFAFGVQDNGVPFCTVFKSAREAVIVPRFVLADVTATSPQTLSLVGLVPANATLVKLAIKLESNETQTSVVIGPSSSLYQNFLEIGPGIAVRTVEVPVSAGLTLDAFLSVNSGESSCEICLEGYCTA
jgi:hypothetical protein